MAIKYNVFFVSGKEREVAVLLGMAFVSRKLNAIKILQEINHGESEWSQVLCLQSSSTVTIYSGTYIRNFFLSYPWNTYTHTHKPSVFPFDLLHDKSQ